MAHLRQRLGLTNLLAKLSFAPVVTIQGVRQCGKSVLIRDILPQKKEHIIYETLDNPDTKDFALHTSLAFLQKAQKNETLAIDEAQKVPQLFDSVKYLVDQERTPGRFILLGSTEFSTMFKIRESLTGRMSRLMLYPLLFCETSGENLSIPSSNFFFATKPRATRSDLMRYLDRGGMPGIFAVRSEMERKNLFKDWLELSCLRDITNIPKGRYDGELCLRILESLVKLDIPDAFSLAKTLRKDSRIINKHLAALKALFIINELPAYPKGYGKSLYFLCDVGFASYLGASFEKKLWTWVIQEAFAKQSYAKNLDRYYYYYRNPKGSVIHLVETGEHGISALKILDKEHITDLDFRLLKSFKEKVETKAKIIALGSQEQKRDGVNIYPWEVAS